MWEGIWSGTTPVAVKTIKIRSMGMQESQIMKKLQHENLIQLYGVCTDGEPLYIITEFMKNGSLLDYLRLGEGRHLKLHGLIDIAAQVASGMAYLETQHYIHVDLTARNVLIGEGNTVKIANFSLACANLDYEYIKLDQGSKFPVKWTAPEAYLYNRFSIKSDVWSYGILLWELITHGQVPYPKLNNSEVMENVKKGYHMPQPPDCPDPLYQIMMDCWKKSPKERPTFECLKYHMEDYFAATEKTFHQLK